MLLNSKEQLIIDHMNSIAKFFGGWKTKDVDSILIRERFSTLQYKETLCHTAAEVMTDGAKRGIYFWYTDKNQNVREAEKRIVEWENDILKYLTNWFADQDKVRERIFVNTDPRGYAFKIRLTQEESATSNIYMDWGHYGILCPDIKLNKWKNELGEELERYMFN